MGSGGLLHRDDVAAKDAADRAVAVTIAAAQVKAPPQPQPPVTQARASPQQELKLSVLDQTLESEVVALSEPEITQRYLAHHKTTGRDVNAHTLITPLPEHEPSSDQISMLDSSLKLGSCWVDFASFVPFGDQARRKEPFRAMAYGAGW